MSTDIRKTLRVLFFSLVALGITVWMFALVSRWEFTPSRRFYVQFSTIGTVMTGSPVRKAGVKIGSVTGIRINQEDGRTVIVEFALNPGEALKVKDQIAIVTGGILGDQFIDVFPGDPNAAEAPPGFYYMGEQPLDFRTLAVEGGLLISRLNEASAALAGFLVSNQEALGRVVDNLDRLSNNLAEITNPQGPWGRLGGRVEQDWADFNTRAQDLINLADKQLSTLGPELQRTLADLSVTTQALRTLSGSAADNPEWRRLLENKELPESLGRSATSLRSTLDNLDVITRELRAVLESPVP